MALRLPILVSYASVDPLAPESRRPRPVAGLPAVDARAVAKAWLIELIAGVSLDEAVELPTAELAREGPGLAAAVLAALGDDTALMRLAPGGNLAWLSSRSASFTGSSAAAGAVRAAEALRRATQAAILSEARLDATTTAELADRLAHVCAVVAEAAAAGAAEHAPAPAEREPTEHPPAEPHARRGLEHLFPPSRDDSEPPTADPRPEPIAAPEAEIVELHRGGGADALRERHERRAEQGSHEAAVERRLERHAHDGSPFALLAVEADGLERLLAAQNDDEIDLLLEALERALAAELRPADQLLREAPGRYWVTAPDTGPAVGRLLAERLAEAAMAAAAHRGAPLTVSIGVATCPEDGDDAETLSGRADRAMFQARAAGTPVV
jgi:GGDEF domain-containing protein